MSNSKDNIFNLKLTDISGENSQEILDKYISNLENFLNTTELDSSSKSIYSAYLNGLKYYQYVSNPNGDFFHKTLDLVNAQYNELAKKFPGLQSEGRIKSVLSADEKIKDKICEYIQDGRDFSHLNYSLRDFVAFRFITPDSKFPNFKFLNIQKCYKILKDHVSISEQQGFRAIPIRQERLNKIKEPHEFDKDPKTEGIYIPKHKSPFFSKRFTTFVKDYIRYPKKSLYQSLHYSVNVPLSVDKVFPVAIEYQFRTQEMHEHSEHGIFSHDKTYKPNKLFHVLNVPTFIKLDSTGKFKVQSFEKNLQTKYGKFEDFYQIPYRAFRKLSPEDQQHILEGTHGAVFNEDTYKWEVNEINCLPGLTFRKYQINHTDIQKKFKETIKNKSLQKEK